MPPIGMQCLDHCLCLVGNNRLNNKSIINVGGAAVVFSLLWRDRKEGSTAATEEKSVLQRSSATSF